LQQVATGVKDRRREKADQFVRGLALITISSHAVEALRVPVVPATQQP
jgi:hypothetical protein